MRRAEMTINGPQRCKSGWRVQFQWIGAPNELLTIQLYEFPRRIELTCAEKGCSTSDRKETLEGSDED